MKADSRVSGALVVRFDRLCQQSFPISSIIRWTAKELCASRWGYVGF